MKKELTDIKGKRTYEVKKQCLCIAKPQKYQRQLLQNGILDCIYYFLVLPAEGRFVL